jgi:hypothetical protein
VGGEKVVEVLIVLGKEVRLPTKASEEEVKSNLINLLRDLDPDLAKELEDVEYSTRIEGEKLVVYRLDAVFG